jgi:hypothetical protein
LFGSHFLRFHSKDFVEYVGHGYVGNLRKARILTLGVKCAP